ncbi:hypothetical protein JRI60_17000 [Archangium violaceum]|uniref:hypothetical protein n=1 Tax=Archangium violaceum TaxID=83451 RepID=UPI00194FBADD|nr:hypothetical protein [Archangium violaceum]QRO00605.1 hypothetical protein JRI60_17000 [Archangium violaceum]
MHKSISKIALVGITLSAGLTTSFAAEKGDADSQTGVVSSPQAPVSKEALLAPTCTLVAPASVSRGQTFNLQVNYNPCVGVGRIETWTISWPSTLANFAQKTVREKRFFSGGNCVVGSSEIAAAPSAGAITGTATVTVEVQGEGFSCSASTTMTVN